MASPAAPTPPTEKPKSEIELLREQVAALAKLVGETRQPGEARVRAPEAPKKFKAWEEDIWVEALQDMVYPDPPKTNDPAEIEYGIYRVGRKDTTDVNGNPAVIAGAVFLLKHREHLNRYHRELSNKEVDTRPEAVPFVPQTTARTQRVRPVR